MKVLTANEIQSVCGGSAIVVVMTLPILPVATAEVGGSFGGGRSGGGGAGVNY